MRPLDLFTAWFKAAFLGSLLFALVFPFYTFIFRSEFSLGELLIVSPLVFLGMTVFSVLVSVPYAIIMSVYVYRTYESRLTSGQVYRNVMIAHVLLNAMAFVILYFIATAAGTGVLPLLAPMAIYTLCGMYMLHRIFKRCRARDKSAGAASGMLRIEETAL